MKKLLTLLLALISSIAAMAAGAMPQTSTADAPVWYMIKFMNGGGVLEAKGDGAKVQVGAQSGIYAQYWRVEGDASKGYTFICRKSGMTLYTETTQTNGMFFAGTSPNANTKFIIKASTYNGYTDGFTISPKSNSGVYMNQWAGPGTGHEIGLWNSVDQNCPVQFISEAEVEEGLKLASLPLIPMPKDVKLLDGNAPMKNFTTVAYADEKHKALAEMYAEMLGAISGQPLSAVQGTSGSVVLSIDANLKDEAYTLTVDANGAAITAGTEHGLFNALQTLRQLFYDAKSNAGAVQCISIKDEPRFEYRGFMLDIARHYFDKDEVKKLLDVMALYKVNKFHWHLTDDQGWRIEIPEYPLLTEVGAVRSGSNTKTTSPRFIDDTEYGRGMYYTLDDLREIVAYAQRLHIDIMPEVDLPGHMIAAITAYPDEFACFKTGIDDENKNGYTVRIREGISKDVLNVAKPEVMNFLYCVLGHVAEVFPYPIIHIGGDECPKDAWNKLISEGNKQFKTWMSDNGLTSADQIQPWLVNELGKWLKAEYGKDVVCWNELADHWKTSYETKPIIMCYNGDAKGPMQKAANLGLRTIYTGCWPFYLDMYQTYKNNYNDASAHQFDDPYTGGYGNNTLQRVYEATPTSSIAGKENLCLGVGANLWTETVNNNREAEHQFFPRMLALAEVGWLPESQKNWMSFRQRVQPHFNILDEYGIQYATYDKDETPTPDFPYAADAAEASRLLTDAQPDAVGYPAAGTYDALRKSLADFNDNNDEKGEALHKAVADFKAAPICQPEPGKLYRIVSASVAWSRDYAGSTLYVTADQKRLRFHYTPQTESEELFRFEPVASSTEGEHSYRITAQLGEKRINLGTLDAQATASATGSVLRVDAATVGSTNPAYYDYIPGVVLISNKNGYTPDGTKSKRLNAQPDGYAYAKADATVGHSGCWRIVEVTDYAAELEALIAKCERLGILADELVAPLRDYLNGVTNRADVTREDYDRFVNIYAEHLKLKYTPAGVRNIIEESAPAAATYDLQGRRATTNAQGVVISGVKKQVR